MSKVSLKYHVVAILEEREKRTVDRFTAVDKSMIAALASLEKAVSLAESNNAAWRANSNEWRAAMNDREARFPTKDELSAAIAQIKEIKETLAANRGRGQGRGDVVGWIAAGIGTSLAIVGVIVGFLK